MADAAAAARNFAEPESARKLWRRASYPFVERKRGTPLRPFSYVSISLITSPRVACSSI
jgi:hypothetical protein